MNEEASLGGAASSDVAVVSLAVGAEADEREATSMLVRSTLFTLDEDAEDKTTSLDECFFFRPNRLRDDDDDDVEATVVRCSSSNTLVVVVVSVGVGLLPMLVV